MKNNIILNILLVTFISSSMFGCASQKNGNSNEDKKADISFNITITYDYCGGVPPEDDTIAELKTPRKFSNQKFYISTKGHLQGNMKEMTTSVAGNVSVSLTKATYYVFLAYKISGKHSGNDRSEGECNKWKNTPDGTFTVEDINSVSLNIHKTCYGCGPLTM